MEAPRNIMRERSRLHEDIESLPLLKRGDIRPVQEEMEFLMQQQTLHRSSYAHLEGELAPLREHYRNDFKYVLRLPLFNVASCVRKYGEIFDKTIPYHEFIQNLCKRRNIDVARGHGGMFYVFKTKEDAEKLRDALIAQQQKADFEVETIDNETGEILPPQGWR